MSWFKGVVKRGAFFVVVVVFACLVIFTGYNCY